MNTAELIYQEARHLPEAEAQEVLDFVAFLKARREASLREQQTVDTKSDERKAALMQCFSHYRIDMSAFKFDREEANARR